MIFCSNAQRTCLGWKDWVTAVSWGKRMVGEKGWKCVYEEEKALPAETAEQLWQVWVCKDGDKESGTSRWPRRWVWEQIPDNGSYELIEKSLCFEKFTKIKTVSTQKNMQSTLWKTCRE